jgi:hypothetical protein
MNIKFRFIIVIGVVSAFIYVMNSPLVGNQRITRFVPSSGVSRVFKLNQALPFESVHEISKDESVVYVYYYLKTNQPPSICNYVWESNGKEIALGVTECKNGDNFFVISPHDNYSALGRTNTVRIFDVVKDKPLTVIEFLVRDVP